MTDVKPCPFCGTPATVNKFTDANGNVQFLLAQCDYCWMSNCEPAAFDTWNTRPLEDVLAARVAELEAQLTMPDGMRHADG